MKYLCLSWNQKELNEIFMGISIIIKNLKRNLFHSIPSNFVGTKKSRIKFPFRLSKFPKGLKIIFFESFFFSLHYIPPTFALPDNPFRIGDHDN